MATLVSQFPQTQGVRQGCPLSPFLFDFAMEVIACYIRHSTLKGIPRDLGPLGRPQPNPKKYSGFADDTTVYMASLVELPLVLVLFAQVEKFSNLSLNKKKCYIIVFNLSLEQPPALLGFVSLALPKRFVS